MPLTALLLGKVRLLNGLPVESFTVVHALKFFFTLYELYFFQQPALYICCLLFAYPLFIDVHVTARCTSAWTSRSAPLRHMRRRCGPSRARLRLLPVTAFIFIFMQGHALSQYDCTTHTHTHTHSLTLTHSHSHTHAYIHLHIYIYIYVFRHSPSDNHCRMHVCTADGQPLPASTRVSATSPSPSTTTASCLFSTGVFFLPFSCEV